MTEEQDSAPCHSEPLHGAKNPMGQLCSLVPPLWVMQTSYRGFFRSAQNDRRAGQNDKRTAEQRPCHSEPLYGAKESHGAIMLAHAAVMGCVDFVQGILSLRSE